MNVDGAFRAVIERDLARIRQQLESRCQRSARLLKEASENVLSGPSPSAPGSPPGLRTGMFRSSWRASAEVGGDVYLSRIRTDCSVGGYALGALLEGGTSRMAARPHHQRILEEARPAVFQCYDEAYF